MEQVYLQIWNPSRNQRYWIVEHNGSTTRPTQDMKRRLDHVSSVKQRELNRFRRSGDDDDDDHIIGRVDSPANPNSRLSFGEESPWVARTGWEEMFNNKDRQMLSALITIPRRASGQTPSSPPPLLLARRGVCELQEDLVSSAEDELKIAAILKLVNPMMDRCEETVRSTNRNLLCWLRSVRLTSPSQEPFTLVRQPTSTLKYRLLYRKLISFIFRVYRLDEGTRTRMIGLSLGNPILHFLDAIWQNKCWKTTNHITKAAEHDSTVEFDVISESESGGGSGTSSDSGESDDDDSEMEAYTDGSIRGEASSQSDGTGIAVLLPMLQKPGSCETEEVLEQLFGLSLALSEDVPVDGKPSSMVMVFFSGILGFSKGRQSFLPARAFTPHLSALIYHLRLFCIEKALPLRPYRILKIEKRPYTEQLERLQKIRKQLTVQGPQSPFDEFFTLRNYGRVAAKSDTPPFLLYWSDDGQTVHWNGSKTLTMGDFRLLQEYFTTQACDVCHELMFSFEPYVDLAGIRDDMTNSTAGYSFVTDPANKLEGAYLELIERASSRGRDDLIANGRWKWKLVDQYLKLEEQFRTYLGLAIQGNAQRARWTELLQLWCENGEFGQRGVFVYKSFIIHLVRHHKAKRSTNREFVVVRFLSASLTRVVYKYLVYIRRFVDLLYRERHLGKGKAGGTSQLLFRAETALGSKPWQSTRFNEVLKRSTHKLWGHAVNSQVMRQLSIGITKKHVQDIHEPFNRFDDKGPNANRNVVFPWQSGHRPAESGRTYGVDGAFPTTLQPQLLDLYQWASMKWHEFLGVPSRLTPDHARSADAKECERLLQFKDDNSPNAIHRSHIEGSDNGVQSRLPARSDSNLPCTPTVGGSHSHQHHTTLPAPPLTVQQAIQQYQTVFGQLGQVSTETKDEEDKIISFVKGYRDERAEDYMLQQRLNTLLKTVEWWELLGCPLCFADTGKIEPDHDLNMCKNRHARRARQIVSWLEELAIPRLTRFEPGSCVICEGICRGIWEGVEPCQEIRLGDAISDARDEETRRRALEEYKAADGSGGHCQRKSRMFKVIAALCACQNQLLSGVLVRVAREHDGKDLLIDSEARFWFERRIPLEEDWFPGMVFAYETLVVGFYCWRNSQRGSPPFYGFPRRPAGYGPLANDILKHVPYGDINELGHWQDSLEWWRDICSFCVGRGLPRRFAMHNLRDCKRKPAGLFNKELGAALYQAKILPHVDCQNCGIPTSFCHSWVRDDDGEWVVANPRRYQCQYKQHYVSEIVLGLYCCGRTEFRDTVVDYHSNWHYFMGSLNGERVANYLARGIAVESVHSSQMMRVMGFLTRDVWDLVGKDLQPN
ncbi:hypothetical protein VFPPC_18572 [Pochonia chlamydosporia 170]|uniref:Uncharacterized protein n=1 Tax=Pochonia chlamydosporia 170 TaxID=1380566 RepID=A0A219ANZ6_METCM|nr:hypothetical protein VFPPC_18572 [Pochonia chlamydosporia 170]OWT42309.1 hypothetical protein VFPPC_18572 [Pochonia chlamydosporia 170]